MSDTCTTPLTIERTSAEAAIHEAWERGDMGEALGLIVEHYQAGIQSYLLWTTCYDHALAGDAWDVFLDALIASLGRFQWRCQCRTWCFKIARSALSQVLRQRRRQRQMQFLGDDDAPAMGQGPGHNRTLTRPWKKTTTKLLLREVLQTLEPDDRALIDLRTFQEMDWNEIAKILSASGRPLDPATERQLAARYRQRYSRLIRHTLKGLLVGEASPEHRREVP